MSVLGFIDFVHEANDVGVASEDLKFVERVGAQHERRTVVDVLISFSQGALPSPSCSLQVLFVVRAASVLMAIKSV